MDMVGQILGCIEHSQKALAARSGSRITCAIPARDVLVPGPLVVGPDRPLDLGVFDDKEPPALHVARRTVRRLPLREFSRSARQAAGPVLADASIASFA